MNAIEIRPIVDKMFYKANAQCTIKESESWVKVDVEAILTNRQTDQQTVEGRIKAALGKFIAAEWALSILRRSNHKSGFEQVRVTAMARVPIKEAYNLTERAQLASEEGLNIGEPELRNSISRETSERATLALRESILKQVANDAKRYSEITGRIWRIGEINFGVSSDMEMPERTSKGTYGRTNANSLTHDSIVDGALTSVTVMTLYADVVLHSVESFNSAA